MSKPIDRPSRMIQSDEEDRFIHATLYSRGDTGALFIVASLSDLSESAINGPLGDEIDFEEVASVEDPIISGQIQLLNTLARYRASVSRARPKRQKARQV